MTDEKQTANSKHASGKDGNGELSQNEFVLIDDNRYMTVWRKTAVTPSVSNGDTTVLD